jgi:hypothetical protein
MENIPQPHKKSHYGNTKQLSGEIKEVSGHIKPQGLFLINAKINRIILEVLLA